MIERHIDARMLQLVLVAHRSEWRSQWCAMSDHTRTQPCRRGSGSFRMPQASTAGPMSRGDWYRTLDRIESRGAKACRKEFGIGIRALRAENPYTIKKA